MVQLVTVDFDGTLFEGDSFKIMFQAGKKEFGIREWSTVLFGTFQAIVLGIFKGKNALRMHFFKSFAKTFKGKTTEELLTFFNSLVEAGENDINEPLVKKIHEHQSKGNHIIILSGALKPFLEALTERLNLAVTIIGTELHYDRNGKCTGDIGVVINGEEKVQAVKNWLKKSGKDKEEMKIWAYADSESDVPLLHFADKPIIVNPKDNMRKIAEVNSWPIFSQH